MVRAELSLGLCDRALRITREIIRANENLPEPYVLRSMALMLTGDLDQAQKHLRAALRLNPDDPEVKLNPLPNRQIARCPPCYPMACFVRGAMRAPKTTATCTQAQREIRRVRKLEKHMETAKNATFSREFAQAAQACTEALQTAEAPQHAPLCATLHADRAAAWLRLKNYSAALQDCAHALRARDDCKNAWLTKASALHGQGRHEEALADMTALLEIFANDTQINGAYQRAEFEVRRAKRPDYFSLLQVPSIASSLEIKAAYKQVARQCRTLRPHEACVCRHSLFTPPL